MIYYVLTTLEKLVCMCLNVDSLIMNGLSVCTDGWHRCFGREWVKYVRCIPQWEWIFTTVLVVTVTNICMKSYVLYL